MYVTHNKSLTKYIKPQITEEIASHFDLFFDEQLKLAVICDDCNCTLYRPDVVDNFGICPECGYHFKLTGYERISLLIDEGTWTPLNELLSPIDSLDFNDDISYGERLSRRQTQADVQDGVMTGTGFLEGYPVAFAVMDFNFLGGSMGSVTGEQLTRLIEYATKKRIYLIIFCASGGARMQEGSLSLMQMGKVSGALYGYQNLSNLFYISVCTSPTTGGVTASFAMLGDVIFAEPGATIAFAGRRVIEETIREELPEGFQTSEYLYEYGQLDAIVERPDLSTMIKCIYGLLRKSRYYQVIQASFISTLLQTATLGFYTVYIREKDLACKLINYLIFNYYYLLNICNF